MHLTCPLQIPPLSNGNARQRVAGGGVARSIAMPLLTLFIVVIAWQTPTIAQDDGLPPIPRPHPERVPDAPGIGGPAAGAAFAPEISPADGAFDLVLLGDNGEPLPPVDVSLVALLSEGGRPLNSGVAWRIFEGEAGEDGTYGLVADVDGIAPQVSLVPGRYLLHAMYGWAGATTQIVVTPDTTSQTVVLNAGGIRLRALVGEDDPIHPSDARFEVWGFDQEIGDRVLIANSIAPEEIIALSAGRYNVVSYYGDTNAIVRADIDVEAGQLTDLALYHEAAEVTLKLVTSRGGEALANTAWSVVTQGGEILFESVGAFPTLVLAAGEYVAIARYNDEIFEDTFVVNNGRDRDVEVLAIDPIVATPAAVEAGL